MSEPTRFEIDMTRQIINNSGADQVYPGGREHALTARTLGCIEGYARTSDPARAVRLIRAALQAERELQAAGTPEYATIMEESYAAGPQAQPARSTATARAARAAAAQARAAAAAPPAGPARTVLIPWDTPTSGPAR